MSKKNKHGGIGLIAVIGDEDTVTGFCLAGIGHRTNDGTNFMVVENDTPSKTVGTFFKGLTERKDIAIILITQTIAEKIRMQIQEYDDTGIAIPTVLEIPSKSKEFDESKDAIIQRVLRILGRGN